LEKLLTLPGANIFFRGLAMALTTVKIPMHTSKEKMFSENQVLLSA